MIARSTQPYPFARRRSQGCAPAGGARNRAESGFLRGLIARVTGKRRAPSDPAEAHLPSIEAQMRARENLGKKMVEHVKALNTQSQQLKKTVADLAAKAVAIKKDFDQVNNGKNPETAALLASRGKSVLQEKNRLQGQIQDKENEFNDFLQKWLGVQIQLGEMSKQVAEVRTAAENSQRRQEIIAGLQATLNSSKISTEAALRELAEKAAAQNAVIDSLVREQVTQREGIALPISVSTSDLFAAARLGGLDV